MAEGERLIIIIVLKSISNIIMKIVPVMNIMKRRKTTKSLNLSNNIMLPSRLQDNSLIASE